MNLLQKLKAKFLSQPKSEIKRVWDSGEKWDRVKTNLPNLKDQEIIKSEPNLIKQI